MCNVQNVPLTILSYIMPQCDPIQTVICVKEKCNLTSKSKHQTSSVAYGFVHRGIDITSLRCPPCLGCYTICLERLQLE